MAETLSQPIYWRGRQWAVTSYGVEALDGLYYFTKDRLWEDEDRGHGWVQHMAEKEWVDIADFTNALEFARKKFKKLKPR